MYKVHDTNIKIAFGVLENIIYSISIYSGFILGDCILTTVLVFIESLTCWIIRQGTIDFN